MRAYEFIKNVLCLNLSQCPSHSDTINESVNLRDITQMSPGKEIQIDIGNLFLDEAKGQDKGANGRIAEYFCALSLAQMLQNNGLRVNTSLSNLKHLATTEIEKYQQSLTSQQINVAKDAGIKMGESMAQSILANGRDLVFSEFSFIPQKHSYDIEPTGAQQSKGSSDDLAIVITEDSTGTIFKKILISLKVYGGTESSQGSNSSMPLLYHLFINKDEKLNKQTFIEYFGEKGIEFVNTLEDVKMAAREFYDSPQGQELNKAKEQDRLSRGKSLKASKVKFDGNYLRSSEVGQHYQNTRGYRSEHKLSKLFVELYNQGKKNLNSGEWKSFNEAFKQAIGFDDVITYKAICDMNGVTDIVSSATSPSYQQMYKALENQIDVILTSKENSGTIGVEIKYKDLVLKSLSCSMWKEGTLQFKFDSHG